MNLVLGVEILWRLGIAKGMWKTVFHKRYFEENRK